MNNEEMEFSLSIETDAGIITHKFKCDGFDDNVGDSEDWAPDGAPRLLDKKYDFWRLNGEPMQVLHLTLKKQWFDMIESGEKKEEYREIDQYWQDRLTKDYYAKGFDLVVFKNGYQKDSPTVIFEYKGIDIGKGRKEWGAPDDDCFIIKLGEKILTKKEQ